MIEILVYFVKVYLTHPIWSELFYIHFRTYVKCQESVDHKALGV